MMAKSKHTSLDLGPATETQIEELSKRYGTKAKAVAVAVAMLHRYEFKEGKMTLQEAIAKIIYDNSWAIYAQEPFTPDSPARIGQSAFDQGGILDGKSYFADGMKIQDAICEYAETQTVEEALELFGARELAQMLIEEFAQ